MRITKLFVSLALASCAVDEPATDIVTSPLIGAWDDDLQIPSQQAERQPSLATLGARLFMIHSGSATPSELWESSFNGSWTTNVKLPMTAANTVGLATYNGVLAMVYQPSGSSRLVMQSSNNGTAWGTAFPAGSSLGTHHITSGVSLVAAGPYLFAAYCREDGAQIDSYDGEQWRSAALIPMPHTINQTNTCTHVALGVLSDGRLDIVYTDHRTDWPTTDESLLFERTASPGTTITPSAATYIDMHSRNPISITRCNGTSILVHGGDDTADEIWWSDRENGAWAPNEKVPSQTSDAGAAVGCLGSTAIMVHNGGTNQLWFARLAL